MQTFINLSESLTKAIADLLSHQDSKEYLKRAEILHSRYIARDRRSSSFIQDFPDVLAYLGLRVSATYAQISGAFLQVKELVPSWKPTTMLDIGSGPGTASWAAVTVWPNIKSTTCLDREGSFLSVGQDIISKSELLLQVNWRQADAQRDNLGEEKFELVVLANILNELSPSQALRLVKKAWNHCSGILIIIEPGTSLGSSIISSIARELADSTEILAPFIENKVFSSKVNFLHFSQRFQRPEFLRRIRQFMRDSLLMASDWEETNYSYLSISRFPAQEQIWGRVTGQVRKQKGFLEVPVLTADGFQVLKILKRYKVQYALAKNLRWGQIIQQKDNLL